jgi:hypothetical protein
MCYKCKSTPLNSDAQSSREKFADTVAVNFLTLLSVCNSLNILYFELGRLRLSRLDSLIWIVSVLHFDQKVVLFFYLCYQNIVKCLVFLTKIPCGPQATTISNVCNELIRMDRAHRG